MALVIVPALARDLTGGEARVRVPGRTVREVVNNLASLYPAMGARLLEGADLKPSIAAIVDGAYSESGLLQAVHEDSEVSFVIAIAGGGWSHLSSDSRAGGRSKGSKDLSKL